MSRPEWLEGVNSRIVKMMGDIEEEWELSVEESNELHDAIWLVLEKLCGYPDYASYN